MTCINDYDQVSPVYKGIRKKDKGFVDVTMGVNSVQGSTLVLDEDLLRACYCSWLASACCDSAGGSRQREGITSSAKAQRDQCFPATVKFTA